MYIGTDIVRIKRMEPIVAREFPHRIFTKSEWDYILSKKEKAKCAAGIFAAKEAVLKCFGLGITTPLTEIEVCHLTCGKPFVNLSGSVAHTANKVGAGTVKISISHDGEYAVSFAVAKKDEAFEFYIRATERLKDAPPGAITQSSVAHLLPKRRQDTHKGDYGRIFVLAGSVGLTGAAVMACTSILKCGAGLITLGCANELNPIFEVALTEVMTKPFSSLGGLITCDDKDIIIEHANKADICLIGPGLGKSSDITELVCSIIKGTKTPCVLDADAIYALSQRADTLKQKSCDIILTPHLGEFANLVGASTDELKKDQKIATDFAMQNKLTLVLKSHNTLVCAPDGRVYKNILGNPGMATGGSGDVLSGAIAAFLAQTPSAEDAAKLGVYIHSLAADMASYKTGEYSLTPSNIIDFIPAAIKYTQEIKGDE